MEEKQLIGSQKEVLARALQDSQMAHAEQKRVNEMILNELGIPEKEWKFWQFSQDLLKVVNQKLPDKPKMPIPKIPKGDKKNGNKT